MILLRTRSEDSSLNSRPGFHPVASSTTAIVILSSDIATLAACGHGHMPTQATNTLPEHQSSLTPYISHTSGSQSAMRVEILSVEKGIESSVYFGGSRALGDFFPRPPHSFKFEGQLPQSGFELTRIYLAIGRHEHYTLKSL
ncbi:uncharacterized protein UTRI_03982 [Ustilago trichophora]|uniref:Uncharacterized protein n=1 Tax=Ustilago trichophora TaxID=86804 RepID=A0A5C3E6R9_9BASI|nr:uncharacterized protein UTRI_03982 [Ustilago trichophora]